MDSIRQRFLQAEQEFLSFARTGDKLTDFADRWETLLSDWESFSREANCDTQQLVGGIVAKIEELATDFYAFESRSLSLEDDLFSGLEDALASLTLEDPCAQPALEEVSRPAEALLPGYSVASPSEWLLRNLHNPYPLPHVRFSTGQGVTSKHIKDWFTKARRRIGWTRLLRDRFAGCRSLAIDAAFRAFIRDDPSNPLSADLRTAFLAIKSHAELVYGDEDAGSRPSPKRLRSVSPTPSLSFSSSSEDTDDEHAPLQLPLQNFNRPSKRMSPDPPDYPSPKRLRIIQPPSPSHLHEKEVSCLEREVVSKGPKKRRLSESDDDYSRRKRSRGTESGRPHAVSDPFPVSTQSLWFGCEQSFQIPGPASIDPLESSSFDLDFFKPPLLPSCAVASAPAPLPDLFTRLDDFSALFEMPQLTLLHPVLPTFSSDWNEFLNFEPNPSLFPPSPLLTPSLADTPSLIDDATFSPSPTHSGPSSPYSLVDVLPHPSEKGTQLHALGEPIIQGEDFSLPPGENLGILSLGAALSTC